MSRTKKFFKNIWTTALYQLSLMVSGFIIPRIMLLYYGSEANGLVSSVTQFVNYLTLVEAGLSGATIFALYKPLAKNDYKEISGIVVAAKRFYSISGWIFTALICGLSLLYPLIVNTTYFSKPEISLLVLIIGVNGALDFFTLGKYRAILTADQKQFVISLSSLVYCILNVLIIAVMAQFGVSLVAGRLVAVTAIFARSIILSLYCKRYYSFINYNERPNNTALNKRWDALYLQILGTVHTGAPIVLSTVFTSLGDVSVYAVYNMVLNGINSILGIFSGGLGAGFGDLIARKENSKLQQAYMEFEFMYYSIITVIYSVAMLQILPFIALYTKGIADKNYLQPVLGFLFVLNGYLYNIKTPQGMLVISAGLFKETRKQTTTQALIAVVGGAVLGKLYGLKGILIAMCLSNLYRDIDLLFFIPPNVTNLSYTESLKNIIISLGEATIIILILRRFVVMDGGVVQWITRSILILFTSGAIVILGGVLLRRRLCLQIAGRIKQMCTRA